MSITKRSNFGINTDEIIFFDKKIISILIFVHRRTKVLIIDTHISKLLEIKANNKDFILLLDEATSHIDDKNFKNLFLEVDKFDTQIWYTETNKKCFKSLKIKVFIHLQ